MNIVTRIALTALAGATTLTGLAATPAVARTDISINYRDGGYGYGYQNVRGWRDDRRWDRGDRWDRRDRYDRRDRGYYGYDRGGYGYRGGYRQRCWTERQWDRWRGSYAVRVCR
jgi:hypothetical protein